MIAASTHVDWTQVLVVGVPSIIAAVFSGIAVIIAARSHRAMKTPSGDHIGSVVERTHDLASVTVHAVTGAQGESVDTARGRLASAAGGENLIVPPQSSSTT